MAEDLMYNMMTMYQRTDAFFCGIGEDSWESLGQKEDQTSQS